MQAIQKIESRTVVLPTRDIDTDQIIPARFLTATSREGFGEHAFHDLRFLSDGSPNPDFALNQDAARGCEILVAGNNFGCGSSREHAVWALHDFGIRAVIAESFGRIFRINCARNGLLTVELPAAQIETLIQQTSPDPQAARVLIDLTQCEIRTPSGAVFGFVIDESDRHMLIRGLDFIDYTLQYAADIDAFKKDDAKRRPWAYVKSD